MDCQNCERLTRENQELRRVIARQQKTIDRLRAVIDLVRDLCAIVYNQARRVMSDHQPRGTWSLWRGRGEVAGKVYNMLSREV